MQVSRVVGLKGLGLRFSSVLEFQSSGLNK